MAQGAFTDLTPYLTGDSLQQFKNLAAFPAYIWENVKFQGKIFGVPKPLWRNGNLAFTRGDWLQALGLSAPEDHQQVHDMLVGFTNNDPDGSGSQDTWGTGRYGGGWAGWDNRLFFPMFGTPWDWRLNPDGTLVHAVETEEFRQGLEFMRQLYADGGYHPDSAGMTYTDARNNFIAGKSGLHTEGFLSFFGIGNVTDLIQDLKPDASTVGLLPPGPNAVVWNEIGYFGYMGIPSTVKDEERVLELLRILDYLASPFGSEEHTFLSYGIEGVHHTVNENGARIINEQGRAEKSDLPSAMWSQAVYYYPENPDLALQVQELALQAMAKGIDDPTLTLYSETDVSEGGTLSDFLHGKVTDVVTGRESIDSVDDFVSEWRDRGGDDVRNEFQEALQSQG
jgi:putative aldouronate transport system substrate-binding protein